MSVLSVARGRILDILVSGRGANGSLGSTAQGASIPAGRFRSPALNVTPRDGAAEGGGFDRMVFLEWQSIEDTDGTANPLDSSQLRNATLVLLVGYMGGTDLATFVHPINSGESTTTATQEVRERALSDAERIKRALADPDLIRGAPSTNPAVVACTRAGPSSVETLGDGRFLCATPYRVLLDLSNADTYDPTVPP